MDNAIEIYTQILKTYILICFPNLKNINPVELNKKRFKVKVVLLAVIIFLKNNFKDFRKYDRDIVSEADRWFKKLFSKNNLFSLFIKDSDDILLKLIGNINYDRLDVDKIDVAAFYETLLSIETRNKKQSVESLKSKNYRNKLGGYFTPPGLAKIITKKTIDRYFFIHHRIRQLSEINIYDLNEFQKKELLNTIQSIKFADFSCGCGNFLIEIIEYFENILNRLSYESINKIRILKSIVKNIYAFDVDCLALEIAKINLLLRIKQPAIYKNLTDNFFHANFLLHTYSSVNDSQKIKIFSSGYIYHSKLSLNKKVLCKYDIILGNPPWEKIRFEEKKFYALYTSNIENQHFKSSRSNEIKRIELDNGKLASFANLYKNEIEKTKANIKTDPFFALSSSGELNTYALFTEAAVNLKEKEGVIGLVLKSAIVTSQVNKKLFNYLTDNKLITEIYDFINRKKIFDIDSRERFCFLLIGNADNEKFCVSMNLEGINDIINNNCKIRLSNKSLILLNPFTGMLPNFTTQKEVDFLLRISQNFPFFRDVFEEVKFGRIVHLTNHSNYISKEKDTDNLPIYEGKFFSQYDGKFSGFNEVPEDLRYGNKSQSVALSEAKKLLKDYFPESRFFINKKKWQQLSKNYNANYMLAWRSLTSASNTRTCIATILPFIPASQSVQFLTTKKEEDLPFLTALFNSLVFDYILKKKLSGTDLTQSIINQVPVPDRKQINMEVNFNGRIKTIKQHITMFVFILLKNDSRLDDLFKNIGISIDNAYNLSRFETIRAIDLFFIFLYQLSHDELELILSSFRKQYSESEITWFKKELDKFYSDYAICSSSFGTSTRSPYV